MSRKSRKNSHSIKKGKKNKYNMKGCFKKNKTKKSLVKNKSANYCPNCGPNCYCGPNCNCNHPCSGTCYLNKQMKKGGASGCGSTACPIAPLSWEKMKIGGCGSCSSMQNGGSCGSCGVMQNGPILGTGQNGGNGFYKPPAPIPGPFVGSGWTGNVAGWPGVNGIDYDKNYLPDNLYDKGDVQTMMKLNGGNKSNRGNKSKRGNKKTHKKRKNGGGLIPQDLVNLGRQAMFNIQSNSNAMNGYPAPTNPAPYKDQFVKYDISSNT